MVAFAEQKAKEINVPVVISVVDSGGHIILMERMEDSLLASIDISLGVDIFSIGGFEGSFKL